MSHDFKKLSGVDSRLNDRYRRPLSEHMKSSGGLNAGLNVLPDKISSFAGTQAADELSDCICLSSRQGFCPGLSASHQSRRRFRWHILQAGQVGWPSPRILSAGVREGYCQTPY